MIHAVQCAVRATLSPCSSGLAVQGAKLGVCINAATSPPDAQSHADRLRVAASRARTKQLAAVLVVGVGFHNAAMEASDRELVEQLFMAQDMLVRGRGGRRGSLSTCGSRRAACGTLGGMSRQDPWPYLSFTCAGWLRPPLWFTQHTLLSKL